MKKLLYFILLWGAFAQTNAHDISFYLEDEPIYTSSDEKAPGFLNEVVSAIANDQGWETQRFYLPWSRAQFMVQKDPRGIIFPLARTETRENSYLWLCKVFDVPVMFVTLDGEEVLNSFDEAQSHRGIGVIQGTPQEERLLQLNIPAVSLTGEEIYPALEKGLVTAIFTAQPEALYGWSQISSKRRLQFGETLMTLPLWIAANQKFNLMTAEAWEEALGKLKSSGRYQTIFKRYFGVSK